MPRDKSKNRYARFLGLPETVAKPDHYELLGLKRFTDDADTIRAGAIKQNNLLSQWQNNDDCYEEVRKLQIEVAAAMMVLGDPDKRQAYNQSLSPTMEFAEALTESFRPNPLPRRKPRSTSPWKPRKSESIWDNRLFATVFSLATILGVSLIGFVLLRSFLGSNPDQAPQEKNISSPNFATTSDKTPALSVPPSDPTPSKTSHSPDLNTKEPAATAQNPPAKKTIQEVLNAPQAIQAEFIGTPLKEAVQYLADASKTTIVLDKPALTRAGLSLNKPISEKLSGMSLKNALERILEPQGLTYAIEGEILKITTDGSESRDDPISNATQPFTTIANNKPNDQHQNDPSVTKALDWLASVQKSDGSWDFQDVGASSSPGNLSSPTGATGLALLAFFGSGHTHTKAGKYQTAIQRGLNWLLGSGIKRPAGLHFGGTNPGNEQMYVQAICARALCEAAARTNDRRIRPIAEGAINFIVRAQHSGGGWRYKPNQPGDTSVLGWQVMALQSAFHAKISIPKSVPVGINKFLNDVSHEDKAKYGYTPGQAPKASTTAIGLLCRICMGWKADNPACIKGVDYLIKTGPSRKDIYYDYYASNLILRCNGRKDDDWIKWSKALRGFLVTRQKKSGPEKGSWDVIERGHKGERGGRLYTTCLAIMILQLN